MTGMFYAAPAPTDAPFVELGRSVEVGQTVCHIEAMKVLTPVAAEKAGEVVRIFVHDGQLVDYDAPLFELA